MFAVPNGFQVGKDKTKNAIQKKKMEREGMRRGVADLILFANGRVYPIEMKTATGTVKPDQKQVHKDWSELAGIETKVCRSVDEFIEYVDMVMKPKPNIQ